MASNETAPAEQSRTPERNDPVKANGLSRVREGSRFHPSVTFKGAAPAKGRKLRVIMPNGRTMQGIVTDATESGGVAVVEFKAGLHPV